MSLPRKILEEKLRRLVEEDIGHGDVTTLYTVPPGTMVEAEVIGKQSGIIAGLEEALIFLESFGLQAKALVEDGSKTGVKTKILHIEGDARTILSLERTLLNLLSRMSGIATATNLLKEKVDNAGYKTRIACTRKTVPGLGYFDKEAVMLGGGDTHRAGLDDMVLIKDNHIIISGSIQEAITRARQKASFSKKIEAEVTNADGAVEAAQTGVDILMLDNFTTKQAKNTVDLLKKKGLRDKMLIEASGGITEQNVLEYAATGVDIVSLGEITQSPKALDISLEIVQARKRRS